MAKPNLLREDLVLPAAVLDGARLAHNLDWMRRFVATYRVELCPHGKTTMAPALFRRQLDAGAWGITLATAEQVRVAHAHGVRRVILANQVVGRQNLEIVSGLLRDEGFDLFTLVDSPESVEGLAAFLAPRGQRIDVLLELGTVGGRAGVRDEVNLEATLAALSRRKETVRLRGVELFEGILSDEAAVRRLLERAVATARRLLAEGRIEGAPILSGAGSAWFDVVAEVFGGAALDPPATVVLRPGCYLTHDVGVYREPAARMTQANRTVRDLGPGLQPALRVWAYVLSRPEEGLAVVGMGKRDVSFDAGLPTPALHHRPGWSGPKAAPAGWTTTRIMDQHAVLAVGEDGDLRVGDMIGFDVSHPCLTFDRWRRIAVLDDRYDVVETIETFFRP